MKTNIKLSILTTAIITVATIIFMGCNKDNLFKKLDDKNDANATQKTSSAPALSTAAACSCGGEPSGCSSKFKKCARSLLNNQNSRNFVINWTSATACGGSLPAPTYGSMCYTGSCNEFYFQLASGVPSCLGACYSAPYCVKGTSVSFSSKCAFSFQYTSDDGSQVITITGDPHISLQCAPLGGVAASCDGDLTWL